MGEKLSTEEVDAVYQLADESSDGKVPGATEADRRAAVADKVRENRLRRMAERQGLRLEKSSRRDPRAADFGTYQLADASNNTIVASGLQSGYGLSLDDVERALTAESGGSEAMTARPTKDKMARIREWAAQQRAERGEQPPAPEFRLRPLIEDALRKSSKKSADPGDAVGRVLGQLLPFVNEDKALEAAVRMCCYLVNEEKNLGGPLISGAPTDW